MCIVAGAPSGLACGPGALSPSLQGNLGASQPGAGQDISPGAHLSFPAFKRIFSPLCCPFILLL